MSYTVIRPFKDLNDPEKHDYSVGDVFPREGHEPTETFINGLLNGLNSAGSIFIEEVPDKKPKKTKAKPVVEEEPATEEEE
ncbi:hypothetical protein HMPREF9967_1043 [Streptococcus infantis SK1076]|uniref:Uncharacterized protein n=1 Tax=Streptococcus infantis SK1076 TaxID=1005705 RepID=F5W028_9STRE|nr:hypothetical protein [Streptococcus infantis]EGL86886.1 hypothetical protein HMPREF9967_1043 [Streptococcus infantis SK1076]